MSTYMMSMKTCVSALLASTVPALADPGSNGNDTFGHMMWGGAHGWWGGLGMILFWGLISPLPSSSSVCSPATALARPATRSISSRNAMHAVRSTKTSFSVGSSNFKVEPSGPCLRRAIRP